MDGGDDRDVHDGLSFLQRVLVGLGFVAAAIIPVLVLNKVLHGHPLAGFMPEKKAEPDPVVPVVEPHRASPVLHNVRDYLRVLPGGKAQEVHGYVRGLGEP